MSLPLPPAAGTAPDRGRAPSIATLALLAALAWAAVILWARSPGMMDAMPGRATLTGAALFAGMWLLMMAAMMLPAITPVALLFRTMQRQRGIRGTPIVPTAAFVAGYLAVWAVAGIIADLAYVAAQAAGERLQAGSGVVPYLGGGIVVLAGIYQFSPLKHVCLTHCRSPFHIILHGWREGRLGALRMGASHGVYCLGCCWGIMAVLFVMGLMNLAWMAALSVLIAVEKLAPRGVALGRLVGVLFIAFGVLMATRPGLFPASGLQTGDTAPMSGMKPAAPALGMGRYTATAGPYAVTLTAAPLDAMGMGGRQERFVVGVTDRVMGMGAYGAHPIVRIAGRGAPSAPVRLAPLARTDGEAAVRYGASVRLPSGAYTVTIRLNGRVATMQVRIP